MSTETVAEIDASLGTARDKLAAAQAAHADARERYLDALSSEDEIAAVKAKKKATEAEAALQQARDRITALERSRERAIEIARATEDAERRARVEKLAKRFEAYMELFEDQARTLVGARMDELFAVGAELLQTAQLPMSEQMSIMFSRSILTARIKEYLFAYSNGVLERGAVARMPSEVLASGQTLTTHARAAGRHALALQAKKDVAS